MKCIDIGTLQALIDGELDIALKKSVESHLELCSSCRDTLEELRKADDFVFGKINGYKQYMEELPETGIKPFRIAETGEVPSAKRKRIYPFFMKHRKLAAVICLSLMVTVGATVQPVRAFISEALNIFRVENIRGIHFSMKDIEEIERKLSQREGFIDIDSIGKIEMTGMEDRVISMDELKNLEDIEILLPKSNAGKIEEIRTVEPGKINFTLNVESMNGILEMLDARHLLPESIDGRTFTVSFAREVDIRYSVDGKIYSIIQMKAPEIGVPADVDADALYNSMVELPIIPENIRRQLKSTKDWRNTLYYPVVEGETETVDIHGSEGFVMGDDANTVILWSRGGVIYSVIGPGEKQAVVELARSLE